MALRHPNILIARHLIDSDLGTYIGFDYVRFTLEEAISVHLAPQESHVHCVATAVFSAIKYLDTEGLRHGNITTTSIRICGRTGKVVLGKPTADHACIAVLTTVDRRLRGLRRTPKSGDKQ